MIKIYKNPDTEMADEVTKVLKANDGYCPCRSDKSPDTVCMCKDFREQESGLCHCGLFVKEIVDTDE